MSKDDDEPVHPFLRHFKPQERAYVTEMFEQAVKAGCSTPEEVVAWVEAEILRRLALAEGDTLPA